jgi:catechol 2,3-dioxygenase-like lactoylglutathione lyase family enzyme
MDGEPKITSPVMRFLPVADVARSSAFYRDILGFEVKEREGATEAILGPARIRFGKEGSAVLFLQTNDVAAMRAAILARWGVRGGAPNEIEKVNWIKMRMFEVRDPDGNVLWFGQTYHEDQDSPSRRAPQPRGMRQVLPELPFDNVAATVTYYCDVLGFRVNYQQDGLGVLDRDTITILLRARSGEHKGTGLFYVYVDDADALYAELLEKGSRVQGPPDSRPWGLRDFSVLDLEGNRITFAQTFE